MKFETLLNELEIKQPDAKSALGIELSIDPRTAKQEYTYYKIEEGKKTKIPEDQFFKAAGQYSITIESAIQKLIMERSNRKRFAPKDPEVMDILAWYDENRKKYIVTATSDDKQLQLEYIAGAKKWVNRNEQKRN